MCATTKIDSAETCAWKRIRELTNAIMESYMNPDGDPKKVERWAKEITWHCSIIESMREEEAE